MADIRYRFLDLKPVNAPYEAALKEAANRVISSGRYLHGEETALLEKEIAELCGARYAIAVSNGLDALRLILRAYKELGIMNDGDQVILPANTFVATALAVSDAGLVPRLVDISPITLNMDTAKIEAAIIVRTRGIMPVHLYGTPCWDRMLKAIAESYHLKIIEDNAQAIGARSTTVGLNSSYSTGALGDAAGWSFYPTKNIGALGDAGMVTTCDESLAEAVRTLANYGADKRYHNIYKGNNCRMDEIQAAFLRVKLRHVHEENARRDRLAHIYSDNIINESITTPAFLPGKQVWHQYPLRVAERDRFRAYMLEHGVETDVIYPMPIHKLPCYADDYAELRFVEAEKLSQDLVCLPIGAHISAEDGRIIADIANSFK